MLFYVIEEKATGFLMPQPGSRERRTALVPVNPSERPPRLWLTRGDANRFLSNWCHGELTWSTYTDYNGIQESDTIIRPGTQRIRDNYRVVELYAKVLDDV